MEMDWLSWSQSSTPDHALLRDLLSDVDWVEVLANATAAAAIAVAKGQKSKNNTNDNEQSLYEVPNHFIALLTIAYGLVSLTAVLGNAIVLWLVTRSSKLRTVTNLYIANLAIADILIGALTVPFQFQAALLQRWVLPHFLCSLSSFAQIVSVNVSIFTLSAIAADRYLLVMYPIKYRISKRCAKCIIFFIWVFGVVAALPALYALKVKLIPDLRSPSVQTQLLHLMQQVQDDPHNGQSQSYDSTTSLPERAIPFIQPEMRRPLNPMDPTTSMAIAYELYSPPQPMDDFLSPKAALYALMDSPMYDNSTVLLNQGQEEQSSSSSSIYASEFVPTRFPTQATLSAYEWAHLLANLSLPLKPHCDNFGLSQHHWRLYNLFLVLIQYFLPLIVISYAYLRMGLKLRSRTNIPAKPTTMQRHSHSHRMSSSSNAMVGFSSSSASGRACVTIQMPDIITTGPTNQCTPTVCRCENADKVQAMRRSKEDVEANRAEDCPCRTTNRTSEHVLACSNCNQCLTFRTRPSICGRIVCEHCGVELMCTHDLNEDPDGVRFYIPMQAFIHLNKKRVIKMLIWLVAMFAFCWLPLQTYNLIKDKYHEINKYRYINVIWFFSHWLAMSSSCVNPFIYAIYTIRSTPKIITCPVKQRRGDQL